MSVSFPNIRNLQEGYTSIGQNHEEASEFTKASLPACFQRSKQEVEAQHQSVKAYQRDIKFSEGVIPAAVAVGLVAALIIGIMTSPIYMVIPLGIAGGVSLLYAGIINYDDKKLRELKESAEADRLPLTLGQIQEIANVEIEAQLRVQETVNARIQELEKDREKGKKEREELQEKRAASMETVQLLIMHARFNQ